ncbi:MAG: hypothetical protein E7457_04115 [Ruminococcaceae bacterium]|nr:hypothetical protein [Oscillospiraceae bacterium]
MKKFLTLLLAAVMCLSLVACGGGSASTPPGDDSGTTDSTDRTGELTQLLCEKNVWYGMCHGEGNEEEFTFFEDGHFEKNGSSFTWTLKEYLPNATEFLASSAFQTTPNYDAARGLYVTDEFLLGYDTNGNLLLYWRDYFCYNESQYDLIEITLDNWQEYFERREYHKFEENGFGEFEKVTTYYSLVSKDAIVFDASKSNVTFEFTCNIETKPYAVDFENKTVTYGETTKTQTSKPTVETMNNVGQYIGENTNDRYGEYLGVCNFIKELEGDAREVVSVEIVRISGSFCVAK